MNYLNALNVTRAEEHALDEAMHLWRVLDHAALCPGRTIRRVVLDRMTARGLFTRVDAVRVDGDGWRLQPERWCDAYRLTWKGHALANRLKRERDRYYASTQG